MTWIKNGLNGANALTGVSISVNLTIPPAQRSVVFLIVCATGASSWQYPTDNFGDGGSWVLGNSIGVVDQFGNNIASQFFTKIIAAPCTGTTVTIGSGVSTKLAANVTCFKPDVVDINTVTNIYTTTPSLISGSGHNSQPVPTPSNWGAAINGFAISALYDDSTVANAPIDDSWSLVAAAASSSPQQGTIQMSGSTGAVYGNGEASWLDSKSSWIVQSRQFAYDVILNPPVIVTNPTVVGTPQVGVASSYTPGSADSGSISAVAWKVNGITVGTSATYTPVDLDAGKTLTVTVTWTNTDDSTPATSAGKVVTAAYIGVSAWFGYCITQGGV